MLIDDAVSFHARTLLARRANSGRSLKENPRLRDYLARVDRQIDLCIHEYSDADLGAAMPRSGLGPTATAGTQQDGRATLADLVELPKLLTGLIHCGGKRIRPLMAYLGFWASGSGEPDETVVRIGAALELLHSFALVHDDVMDESPTRRGVATTQIQAAAQHRELSAAGESARFGENVAILLGDLAHAAADDLIAECPTPVRDVWRTLVRELIRGQLGDLTGAADRARDPELALSVADQKSGSYTVHRPLELGAIAAGARPEVRESLAAYGREIGWAFALRDDILGVWGDPAITGKPAGDDLIAGKPTVIIALASQRLAAAESRLLTRVASAERRPADVERLQWAIHDAGVRADVEEMISQHVDRGLAHLAELEPKRGVDPAQSGAAEATALLTQIADQVAWRDR
ncbi:polyprenyl synthetase family protein [Microlunatus elymi]|nr:polyprenyl synthetase family protein [Microlunatus elymi]